MRAVFYSASRVTGFPQRGCKWRSGLQFGKYLRPSGDSYLNVSLENCLEIVQDDQDGQIYGVAYLSFLAPMVEFPDTHTYFPI